MLPSTSYHPEVGTSVHLDIRLGERNAILHSHQLFIIGKSQTSGNQQAITVASLLSNFFSELISLGPFVGFAVDVILHERVNNVGNQNPNPGIVSK